MKKSRGLFYAGLGGIVVVLVIAVVVIVTSRGASPGGTSSAPGGDVVTLTCLGGSEKEDLMADPEVKKILRDKYRIEVDFNATGSYKQVQIPTDELKANKIDCLWPSSASAQAIFEGSGNNKAFGNDYRAESVLQSPEVLYANREAAEGLRNTGIVQVRDNVYFIVDFKRLLEDYMLKSKSWADVGVSLPAGPLLINSSDPATSNSGMTLAQLELATIVSGNPYQPATTDQARASLAKVKELVDAQGLMRSGFDSAFEQWVIQQTGGLLAGYENQLLQWITTRNQGTVPEGIVTLYPETDNFQRSSDSDPHENWQQTDRSGRGRRGPGYRVEAVRFSIRNPAPRAGVPGRHRAANSRHQEDASPRICGHQASPGLLRQQSLLTLLEPFPDSQSGKRRLRQLPLCINGFDLNVTAYPPRRWIAAAT